MDSTHDDASHRNPDSEAEQRQKRQPGAFPPVGAALTVQRRAYVLADSDGRTWLALDPVVFSGGVMQPLRPGETAKVVQLQEDGIVLRVSSQGALDADLDAFLVPRRLVPPAMERPEP